MQQTTKGSNTMNGVYRTASILIVVGCTSLLRGQNVPPNDAGILRDRELAKLTALGNYMTVIGALERLAAAKDFDFLCELLPNASENARSTLIGHLYNAPDDMTKVSLALYNYMAASGDPVANSNGENVSALEATAERTIDRLNRVLGVPAVEVDFRSSSSVRQYIEKIRPLMEKLQASTQGAPPLAKPPVLPPPALRDPKPPTAVALTPAITTHSSSESPANHAPLFGWLAVAVGAIGLLWLAFKKRK